MGKYKIPEKINLFNAYVQGSKLIGVSDEVTLPNFEAMTETISGAGIIGEIDSPAVGHFGSMELQVPFRTVWMPMFELMKALTTSELTLRGGIQCLTDDGSSDFVQVRVVVKGRAKNTELGKMKQTEGMESSVTLELVYIMVELDGEVAVELDKLNAIFKLNGEDVMAKVRDMA